MMRASSFKAKFKVKDLIDTIRKNYNTHLIEYFKAKSAYLQEYLEHVSKCEKSLETFKSGLTENISNLEYNPQFPNMGFKKPEPKSYNEDYERLIKTLEMVADEEIELDSDDMNQIIHDKWAWSNNFKAVSQSYGV